MLHDERGHVRTFTTGNGAGATFTYDDRGLVKSLSVGTADGTELLAETYRYDENGNRTEDGEYQYEWNEADQLVSITRKGESTPFVTYQYDEDGRRIQKNVNGVVTNYHYQGDSLNVLYETDASGNVVQSYIYGENGQLLAMKKGGVTYFYHYNAHGDVIALTDAQGNVVARYEYDTWGQIRSETGSLADENPYRYAGYQYDEETGLYYLIARYYHPTHGVFLSLDPDPGDADDILTQNGYTYANNNPVMLVDPDGHFVWMAINAGFAAYDGYKAYKSGKGWKGVAAAAAINFVGFGGKFKAASKIIKAVHGNSRFSKRIHHGYEIYEIVNGKKRIVKVGISGAKLNKNGTSPRANRQVNKWNKKAGYQRYYARIVKRNIYGREKALKWERGRAYAVRKAGGNMYLHVRP